MKQLELIPPGESTPIAKESPRCTRCNRKLTNPAAIARGMGQVCYHKQQEYVARFLIDLFADNAKITRAISPEGRHARANNNNRQSGKHKTV